MVCRSTCCGKSCSRCRMLPLVYSPAHGAVTTSLQCCINFIGCRFRDEWNLRLRVLYTNRSRTCLPTFDSSKSMISPICIFSRDTGCSTDEHQLRRHKFRCCGTAPVQGTLCRLRYDRSPATDSLATSKKTWVGQLK